MRSLFSFYDSFTIALLRDMALVASTALVMKQINLHPYLRILIHDLQKDAIPFLDQAV
jgi:hypothetical protein